LNVERSGLGGDVFFAYAETPAFLPARDTPSLLANNPVDKLLQNHADSANRIVVAGNW